MATELNIDEAVQAAIRHNDVTLLEALLSRGSSSDRGLHAASRHGHVECVQLLLANNAAVDEPFGNGSRPLLTACHQGGRGCVQQLLAARAAVDRPDDNGKTPLHLACNEGHSGCVQLLLDAHATFDAMALTRRARRLRVDNLPLGVELTADMLTQFFNTAIVSANLHDMDCEGEPVFDCLLSGEGMFGFVEFRTIAETLSCLALDSIKLGGKQLRIQQPRDYQPMPEAMHDELKKCAPALTSPRSHLASPLARAPLLAPPSEHPHPPRSPAPHPTAPRHTPPPAHTSHSRLQRTNVSCRTHPSALKT